MKRKLFQTAYKGDHCGCCLKSVRDEVEAFGDGSAKQFEFHHVDPSTKDPNYENLIRRKVSTAQLDELDKCVLVCRNCHAIIESQQNPCHVELLVKVGNRRASQVLKGAAVIDYRRNSAVFVTNQQIVAIPYWVRLPNGEPKLVFGTELRDGKLVNYLTRLETLKSFEVHSYQGGLLLRADRSRENVIDLRFSTRFPIIQARFFDKLGGNIRGWLRNGTVVTWDGTIERDAMVTLTDVHLTKLPEFT